MLIIGPTGSGKSVHRTSCCQEQKYGGFTYIFDIGGSYDSPWWSSTAARWTR